MADDDYIAVRTKKFSNGDLYTGTWAPSGLPDGEGKYVWQDGSTFEGSWKDGAKHGIGKYTWPSGATYHGEWLEGSMHGVGTWESADGRSRYQGGWHENLKHGLGRQVYANGDLYEGLWKLGFPSGPGRYVYADGNEYDGEWRAGRMHGHGTFVWRSGERYDGEWKEGRMDGCGVFTAADSSVYDGCWRRGRKHGVGIFKPGQGQGQGQAGYGPAQPHAAPGLGLGLANGLGHAFSEGGAAAEHGNGGRYNAGAGNAAGRMGPGKGAAASAAVVAPAAAPGPQTGDLDAAQGSGYGNENAATVHSPFAAASNALVAAPSADVAAVSMADGNDGGGLDGGQPQGALQYPSLPPLSSLPPILFPSLPPSAPDSPRSPMPGGSVADGSAWMWAAAAAASAQPVSAHSLSPSPTASGAPSHLGSRLNLASAASGPQEAEQQYPAQHLLSPGLQQQQQQHQQQGPVSNGSDVHPGGQGAAGWHPSGSFPVTSHPIPIDAGPAEVTTPQPQVAPGLSGQAGQQQQQPQRTISQQQQQCNPRRPSNPGASLLSSSSHKMALVRVYDKGRPVRETALSLDELEIIVPGLLAPGRRGSLDRGPGQLLRRLRGGGSIVGGSSRPRPWPRMGDTVTRAHSSYALMVALQLGIRYSVGRISHEPLSRNASKDEYSLRVLQEFPRGGSEMTPVHPVEDFTWSDYAPLTFRRLRESFGVDASTYMLSLCSDQSLRHLASPGKSGSVFFLSQDERFFIKTMSRAEMDVLLSSLPAYHRHVDRHPHTLLCRFFGVHCVTTPGGKRYRFVVMSNIFRTPLQLHRKYDLKGSTVGRTAGRPPSDDPTVIFKDLDLDLTLRLEDGWRDRLLYQLRADCGLLSGVGVMDYSLLVGLHFRNRGGAGAGGEGTPGEASMHPARHAANHVEHDNAAQLALEYPRVEERIHRLRQRLGLGEVATGDLVELAKMRMLSPHGRGSTAPHGAGLLRDMKPDPGGRPLSASAGDGSVSVSVNDTLALSMGQSRVQLGLNMAATAVFKDGREEEAVIWFALIDILQPYNATKRLEHKLKSVIHASHSISVTHPNAYASRFQAFMKQVFE